MSRANHLEVSARKHAKNGIHAIEIVELADSNMALKTWLGLGNICDLAIKCDHINNRII